MDYTTPSQTPSDASPEQAGQEQGERQGLSSIQKLKMQREQARLEALNLRNEISSLREEIDSLKTAGNPNRPKSVADYTEEDFRAIATREDIWDESPNVAVQAILGLLDKKFEKFSSSVKDSVINDFTAKTQRQSNLDVVKQKIVDTYGDISENPDLEELAIYKLKQYLARYDRDGQYQSAEEFVQQYPEYMLWSVKEAAEELGYQSKARTERRSAPSAEDRQLGVGGASSEVDALRKARDEALKRRDTKGQFSAISKMMFRRPGR